ncbi:MAG: HDIG domain-containing protein [Desulfovermiculus sp.]
MDRENALEMLHSNLHEASLINHSLETEAVMRGLAGRLGADPEMWGLAGLLHDLDFEQTRNNPADHGLISARKLQGKLPEEAVQAIAAHNCEVNGTTAQSTFDYALRCAETVTGLISANALVRPEGMEDMKPKSLKKKMKDKSFAANVDRERIKECEKIGLDLGEFLQIGIAAMQDIASEVGLEKKSA